MAHLVDKSALVAEIESKRKYAQTLGDNAINSSMQQFYDGMKQGCVDLLSSIDTLEVKEMEEYKQPEYSCFETTYKCGKKHHWNIGDTLAFYEFYSDIEGECVLGKVTKVELEEDENDWLYTFEDGSQYDEASLLEEKTYKKK